MGNTPVRFLFHGSLERQKINMAPVGFVSISGLMNLFLPFYIIIIITMKRRQSYFANLLGSRRPIIKSAYTHKGFLGGVLEKTQFQLGMNILRTKFGLIY